MDYIKTLQSKMIEAMKRGESDKKSFYSFLLATVQKVKKDNGEKYNDEMGLKSLIQEQKALENILEHARNEAEKKDAEFQLALLKEFMPEQITLNELLNIIQKIVPENSITFPIDGKTKGLLMKSLMSKVKGRADGTLVKITLEKFLEDLNLTK